MGHEHNGPQPPAVTEQLCKWAMSLQLDDVPVQVRERAKHLLVDAVGCGIVGSHVPWSADAKLALDTFEGPGRCTVIGWEESYSPLGAALLNGTFIQACELDDYHSAAPLHSGSIIFPALLAAAQALKLSAPPAVHADRNQAVNSQISAAMTGKEFLLAAIVGFESGPRIGLGVHGIELLSKGWHSGPVFGSPTAALATSKLFRMSATEAESAMSIACTQAGGLMAAQYDGSVKRMQHAFAARNGLLASLLAKSGYKGFTKVLERPYGGFLKMFSLGSKYEPQYRPEEVVRDLGEIWHTEQIRIKLYACVGAVHGMIEALASLQEKHPDLLKGKKALETVDSIEVGLSMPALQHDGWSPDVRPLTTTGAQMCAAYIAATQLIDGQVLLAQFADSQLDRDAIWALVPKINCVHAPELDIPNHGCGAFLKIKLHGEQPSTLEEIVKQPRGFNPPVTNEDIRAKFMTLTSDVIGKDKAEEVLMILLTIDEQESVDQLAKLLAIPMSNALS